MTELRRQMDNAMLVRGMAERTREAYLAAVARLARHYHRSPDQLSPAEVQAYLVHMLREEHLAWSTCNIAVQAFRFFYHTTLGHPAMRDVRGDVAHLIHFLQSCFCQPVWIEAPQRTERGTAMKI